MLLTERIEPLPGAWYSPEEASNITGRSTAVLAMWRSNGGQPGLKWTATGFGKNRRIRYKGSDLIAWLSGKRNLAPKKVKA